MKKSFYQVLGVPETADQNAINSTYTSLLEKYETLRRQGDTEAGNQLIFLREAFAALSNPERRAAYDSKLAQTQSHAEPQPKQELEAKSLASKFKRLLRGGREKAGPQIVPDANEVAAGEATSDEVASQIRPPATQSGAGTQKMSYATSITDYKNAGIDVNGTTAITSEMGATRVLVTQDTRPRPHNTNQSISDDELSELSYFGRYVERMGASGQFIPLHILKGADGVSGIAVDERHQKVALVQASYRSIYTFEQIIGAEIVKDGETITQTKRNNVIGRSVGGALLGGVFGIFGAGVGAVIGGTTTSSTSTSREVATRVTLRIQVEDLAQPIYEITIAIRQQYVFSSGMVFAQHVTTAPAFQPPIGTTIAEFWMSLITAICHKVERSRSAGEMGRAGDGYKGNEYEQQSSNTKTVHPRKKLEIQDNWLAYDRDIDVAIKADSLAKLNKALQGVSLEDIRENSFALMRTFFARGKPPYKVVSRLLEMGVDLEAKGIVIDKNDEFGFKEEQGTILEYVILLQKDEAALLLVKNGAKIPPVTVDNAPIAYAVSGSDTELLKLVHQAGADLNARTPDGVTPLMYACRSGRVENVRYLISNGVDVNAVDNTGKSALDYVDAEAKELRDVLIQAGARPG